MHADLSPPVAVVSGGGTGIGRAAAAALAADGMDVVIVGRRADVLRAAADEVNRARPTGSGELSWARADVSDPAELARAVEEPLPCEAGQQNLRAARGAPPTILRPSVR